MSIAERITSPGKKKILTLDGGGIRGMITIEVLGKIEQLLRKQLNKGPDFVLADYFDFVAGTSTGAIIATCISLGMPVEDIKSFYTKNGRAMFDKAFLLNRLFFNKYKHEKLARKLRNTFGAKTTLGSDTLRTVLMMVMRNATTNSPWPISNNPFAKYNESVRRNTFPHDCNLDMPLWKLVRASTAAPTYFPPEVIKVGSKEFVFVDGGVTMYNNPAFQAFLMATVEPYNMNWQVGENNLLVVSVGTGYCANANKDLKPSEMNILYNASSIPSALMFAASNEQDFLCRVFGDCKAGDLIDREVRTMMGKQGPVSPKLFTYLRYDVELSRQELNVLCLKDILPENVQKMDSVDHMEELQRVGAAIAEKNVESRHFERFL